MCQHYRIKLNGSGDAFQKLSKVQMLESTEHRDSIHESIEAYAKANDCRHVCAPKFLRSITEIPNKKRVKQLHN